VTATSPIPAPAASPPAAQAPLLSVRGLEVVYNEVVLVLRGVDIEVPPSTIVTLLGANGAGKTTLLRAISGLLPLHRGRITRGTVELGGKSLAQRSAPAVVRAGISQVMEGRRIFASLTVDENLRVGAITRRDRGEIAANLDRVLTMFPRLADRRKQVAGYLSGGEQQMLAIGRALMASPHLMLLDEPSLGLAPLVVEQIKSFIVEINAQGTAVLLVEQNAAMALSIAHHGYVIETGRIVRSGPGQELLADRDIREFYLGIGEAGHHSFRNVKTYRRSRRWSG
jgi:branched-chain amino acid transport system ATP-binding protein